MNLNPFRRKTRIEEIRVLMSDLAEERNRLERDSFIEVMTPCLGRFFTYKDASEPTTIWGPQTLNTFGDPRLIGWKLTMFLQADNEKGYELRLNTSMSNLAHGNFYKEVHHDEVLAILSRFDGDIRKLVNWPK